MSRHVTASVVALLPDDWAVVDLEDADARREAVDELVERRLGGLPRLAPLRQVMHQDLLRRADHAARAGGLLMALAVGDAGAPTVPASLTVYRVPGSLDERGRAAMVDVLASDEPGHTLDLATGPTGAVLRRVRTSHGSTDLTGDRALPSLLADYWVEVAPGSLVYLVFSSPLVDLRDELLALFDAVVASVRVLQPADTASPSVTAASTS